MIPVLFEHDGSWENTLVKVDGATPQRWRFLRGYDKPIHRSCAIYFYLPRVWLMNTSLTGLHYWKMFRFFGNMHGLWELCICGKGPFWLPRGSDLRQKGCGDSRTPQVLSFWPRKQSACHLLEPHQGLAGTSPEPQRSKSRAFMLVSTLLGTSISPSKALLKLIFLFQKWIC